MNERLKLKPFTYKVDAENEKISNPDNHIIRKLSSMKGQYMDEETYKDMLERKTFFYMRYMKN
jgi:oxalate decarboxylase/phosphoglucose isomerase-like protein (cupin superfamily)